jgi:NAD(P)-dependent dehydrogenase (short-subunit alcohol dehydrogenase family)
VTATPADGRGAERTASGGLGADSPAGGSLSGRVVAVPGAGGSLGPHVVRALVASGATLELADVSADALAPLAGERVGTQVVDLLDAGATAAWSADLEERHGHVDGLVHLVGGWRGGKPLAEAPLEDWDVLHDLLVRTVQHTTRAFHGALTRSSRGRFVLMSAKQAVAPTDTNAAYATAKAAAEAWTYALAEGFASGGSGATANVVAINALVTPQMREAEPEKAFKTFTDATDIAQAIRFLLSDAAAKMNGQRLALYG